MQKVGSLQFCIEQRITATKRKINIGIQKCYIILGQLHNFEKLHFVLFL